MMKGLVRNLTASEWDEWLRVQASGLIGYLLSAPGKPSTFHYEGTSEDGATWIVSVERRPPGVSIGGYPG